MGVGNGILDKFGASAGGAGPIVIIAPVAVPQGEFHRVTEFGATLRTGGADMVVAIQMSNDGFVGNIVEKDRIEMPSEGTFLKTYGPSSSPSVLGGLVIPGGFSWRAVFSQGTPAAVGVKVSGNTQNTGDFSPSTDVLDVA